MRHPLNTALDELEDAGLIDDLDEVTTRFFDWVESTGRAPYPHQEDAVLALAADEHVILATPTGSGKSLVAMGALFLALAQGRTAYYTAPLKALVSEKFFDLIDLFGAHNVGMLTGDSAINSEAPIICCTAEILANHALREGGRDCPADPVVVMDEFHFYSDRDRGWAWQVPLLELPRAQHLLMSATLGDVTWLMDDLAERTGRDVSLVDDAPRPVPLNFAYSFEPLGELMRALVADKKAPAYVVHFSQKEAVASAESLMSTALVTKEEKAEIASAIKLDIFARGFGKKLRKFLEAGVAVHHAGLLPRYRRIVERLAQRGLLKVICGTDTLGVGINVPIRTVVLTALGKFDGRRQRQLSAREFHQIAGRAGRAGFDVEGDVVVQAPSWDIENAKARAKAGDDPKKLKKLRLAKPEAGKISWSEKTFEKLRDASPETLRSRMQVNHAMVLNVLCRPSDPVEGLYELLTDNHEPHHDANPLLRQAIHIYMSLREAGLIDHHDAAWRREHPNEPYVDLAAEIPDSFQLNAPLSPFALAAFDLLDPDCATYALDVISVIEATLEDPKPLLFAQEREARGEAIGALKAEGVEYDQRMEIIEEITWPRPLAELLEPALETYRQSNPWVAGYELKPKSVVRYMVERARTFTELISDLGLANAEGLILRYLTDCYRAMRQVIPDSVRTAEVEEIITWLGDLIRAVDSSLIDEWEALADGRIDAGDAQALAAADQAGAGVQGRERRLGENEDGTIAITRNLHGFRAKVRQQLHAIVKTAALDDVDKLAHMGRAARWSLDLGGASELDRDAWDSALGAYWDEHDWIGTVGNAISTAFTEFSEQPEAAELAELGVDVTSEAGAILAEQAEAGRLWVVRQKIDDPDENGDWYISALVDLEESDKFNEVAIAIVDFSAQ